MATPDHIRIPRPKIIRSFQTTPESQRISTARRRKTLHRLSLPPDQPTLFPLEVTTEPRHEHVARITLKERMPLVYGSAAIEMCACMCWRLARGCNDEWRNSDYREEIREALVGLEER